MGIEQHLLLGIGTFVITFVGAISGGTGTLTRPLIMFVTGLPPQVAVATARAAHFGARAASILQFHKHGKIDWRLGFFLMLPSVFGSLLGVYVVASLGEETLTRLIGIFILLMGFLLAFKPNVGIVKIDRSALIRRLGTSIGFFLSSIAASVSGGGGIVGSYVLIFFGGQTYIESAATRVIAGSAGAVVAVAAFIYLDFVSWTTVPTVLIAGAFGNWFGVRWGIKKGEKFIRILTLIVIFAVGIRMLVF